MDLKERLRNLEETLGKQEVLSEFSNSIGLYDLEDFNNSVFEEAELLEEYIVNRESEYSVFNELIKFIGASLVLQELHDKLDKIVLEKTITKIERKIIQGVLPQDKIKIGV